MFSDPRSDLASVEALADVGEIVGPVTHEFNNLLHSMMLQVAIMDQKIPDELRSGLATMKRSGRAAAALVRLIQQYRRRPPSDSLTSDLNAVAEEVVGGVTAPAGLAVEWTPHPGLPPIRASRADLRRLLTFLLGNAVLTGGTRVSLRTEAHANGVALTLELAGPGVDPNFVAQLTSSTISLDHGTAGLELAASPSLVRRLNGELMAEATAEGGARVVVTLPAVS